MDKARKELLAQQLVAAINGKAMRISARLSFRQKTRLP